MTVTEVFEQAKALSPEERKELTKLLIDTLGVIPEVDDEPDTHWGKSITQMLDKMEPIEMKYPEIEDPVEWVKHLRAEERRRRLGDLDNAE